MGLQAYEEVMQKEQPVDPNSQLAQQVRDPASAGNRTPADGLDGPSAHAVMQRYRASFAEANGQAPQPVQFMLGGGNGK